MIPPTNHLLLLEPFLGDPQEVRAALPRPARSALARAFREVRGAEVREFARSAWAGAMAR
ncbi:MAG: hypothetical protein U0360_08525 [Dehalococcoidia bacterium]